MKSAVLLILVVVVAISAGEEFKCQEHVPYKENECNGCDCTSTGRLICTLKECSNPRNKELKNCEVGTTSEKDCNKCWCLAAAGTICTDNKC